MCKYLRSKPVTCNLCSVPCMSPVIYAIHKDQHEVEVECEQCSKKYPSVISMYLEDMCGDNAIPKNVKTYVNNTISKLVKLEEDTEIIAENFGLHYTKYAKRPLMNDLPMDYRTQVKKPTLAEKKKRRRERDRRNRARKARAEEDYIPSTVEEWVLNIPHMLDAR